MKYSFTMPLSILKACRLAASKEETRYYLNGVAVEFRGNAPVAAVATDGHILIAAQIPEEHAENSSGPFPEAAIIIPWTFIDAIKLSVRSNNPDLQIDIADAEIIASWNGQKWFGKLIDGTFPDWRRIVPDTADGTPGHYNPEYLMKFKKAAALIDGGFENPIISQNGEGPALVQLNATETVFGVIMPLRVKTEPMTRKPDWAK